PSTGPWSRAHRKGLGSGLGPFWPTPLLRHIRFLCPGKQTRDVPPEPTSRGPQRRRVPCRPCPMARACFQSYAGRQPLKVRLSLLGPPRAWPLLSSRSPQCSAYRPRPTVELRTVVELQLEQPQTIQDSQRCLRIG